MKMTMVNYTGLGHKDKWHAANLLIFTKNTRLKMQADLFEEISNWSEDKKMEELEYMSNTIPSSWEFIDYVFLIEDCTRAFTHQLVRTRTNSYAQQTMRILDVSGFTYETGPSIKDDASLEDKYSGAMDYINNTYKELIACGADIQDARGILPTNIHTNIVVKMNLRTAAETVSKRTSIRTQGEYRDFVFELTKQILEVHPWSECFLRNRKYEACNALEKFILSVFEPGKDPLENNKIDLIKQLDILRS